LGVPPCRAIAQLTVQRKSSSRATSRSRFLWDWAASSEPLSFMSWCPSRWRKFLTSWSSWNMVSSRSRASLRRRFSPTPRPGRGRQSRRGPMSCFRPFVVDSSSLIAFQHWCHSTGGWRPLPSILYNFYYYFYYVSSFCFIRERVIRVEGWWYFPVFLSSLSCSLPFGWWLVWCCRRRAG